MQIAVVSSALCSSSFTSFGFLGDLGDSFERVLRIATGCAGGKLIQIFSVKKIWRRGD
jgi:hypothetical protein